MHGDLIDTDAKSDDGVVLGCLARTTLGLFILAIMVLGAFGVYKLYEFVVLQNHWWPVGLAGIIVLARIVGGFVFQD